MIIKEIEKVENGEDLLLVKNKLIELTFSRVFYFFKNKSFMHTSCKCQQRKDKGAIKNCRKGH
jgi:hypothetical protein